MNILTLLNTSFTISLKDLLLIFLGSPIVLIAAFTTLKILLSTFISGFRLQPSELKVKRYKHALVTGGSSGIGLEVARIYLKRGFNVTILARDQGKLETARQDLQSSSTGNVKIVSCDVTNGEKQLQKALSPVLKDFGPVDVLVVSAGTSVAADFDTLQSDEFERMMRINYLGSVFPIRVILPEMKRRLEGSIVLISSQVAQVAISGYTAYAPSKWALRGLAEALHMELKPYNINVSIAFPPDTDTPGYKQEMLTKPDITREISESGCVFSPEAVAKDIISGVDSGKFSISTGLDGFLLTVSSSGMSPISNSVELTLQIIVLPIARLIGAFYLLFWEFLVARHTFKTYKANNNQVKEALSELERKSK